MATAIRSASRPGRARPSRDEIDPAATELLERHGAQLMATARRYAATPEDAEDAYQRGVEILLTKAPTTDPRELLPWLKTVVKHEAFAVRRQADRHGVPSEPAEIEPYAGSDPSPADIAERRDRLRLGAEAMSRLKPQEVRALMLRADGLSYQEICDTTGWTYTKVNRCLSEGRRSFVERVAGIETGEECERVAPLLSALADGEIGREDLARLRPHLRGCLACRARLREYRAAPSRVAAVAPVGLIASLCAALRGAAKSVVTSRVDGWGQAIAAHKSAAVAASTIALAGGGAATVATLPQHPSPRPPIALPREPGGSVRPRDAAISAHVRARYVAQPSRAARGTAPISPAPSQQSAPAPPPPQQAPAASQPPPSSSSSGATPSYSTSPAPATAAAPAAPAGGRGGEFAP